MFIQGAGTAERTYDAIVVGSGISGGWAAKELTEKGLKTLVLERGPDVLRNRNGLGVQVYGPPVVGPAAQAPRADDVECEECRAREHPGHRNRVIDRPVREASASPRRSVRRFGEL